MKQSQQNFTERHLKQEELLQNHLKTRKSRQKELRKKQNSKQQANEILTEQTFILCKKVQNRAQKEEKQAEILSSKEENQRG